MNGKECGKKWSLPDLWCYPRFCLEGPKETMENRSQKCSNQDLNRASTECKPGALLCELTCYAKGA
jgi:hypothetical protein